MGKENLKGGLTGKQAVKLWERPDYREAVVKGIKDSWRDDAARKKDASERLKGWWNDRVYRENMSALRTGRHHSAETKAKISASSRGHLHDERYKEEASLKRGGVRAKATPLLLRGAMVEEVAQITGYERAPIGGVVTRLRKDGELKRPTKEEASLTKKRAHQGKPRFGIGRIYPQEEQNAFAFVRGACEKDLVAKDLTNWQKLIDLYQKWGRVLPDNFASRVRLEIFLYAIEQVQSGDKKNFEIYRQIGRQINPQWFSECLADEEDFICETVDSLLYCLPKPLEEYPKWLQKIITAVDKESFPRKTKQALFIYLAHALGGWGTDVTARDIGIPQEQVEKGLNFVRDRLRENDWQHLEEMANQLYK